MLDKRLRKMLLGRLESLQQAGITHLPRRPVVVNEAAQPTPPPALGLERPGPSAGTAELPSDRPAISAAISRPAAGAEDIGRPGGSSASCDLVAGSADPRMLALNELARRVAECTRCWELVRQRTQTVFGVGNPYARLVFVGEAPGEDEDRQGEPFVGAAGQLLNRILAACRLRREEVYIMNILRCRPPGNRTPSPEEAHNCREFLEGQLEIIRPQFICCLGACAAQNLLETRMPIGKLRGKVHKYRGAKVICTYHPAYLLRNPAAKKDCWEDMKLLMAQMGVQLPDK